jgi:hypothetical protein
MRFLWLFSLSLLVACNGEIYTRDGVTDGDSFYLAPVAFASNDAATQAWVAYSLMKSVCQLEIGGDNPARANSFQCEFKARSNLVNTWQERLQQDQQLSDTYLDTLTEVQYAGFLAEYTVHYFGNEDWSTPDGLRELEFERWRRTNLRGHKPRTRLVGSWNYRENIEGLAP